MVNSSCPLRTSCPSVKCTPTSCPAMCDFTSTVEYGCTSPMARTVSGTIFCSTVPTVTGTATGAALCAFWVVQPVRPAIARPSVSVSDESVRALAKLFLSPVLVAIPVLRRMTVAIRFRGRQNAAQPDVCELRAHRCRVEALVDAATKDLLHEVVVEEHSHESARGD